MPSENPPDLRSLQAAFAAALVDDGHIPGAGIFNGRGLTSRQRLNVYFNNSQIVQTEALAAIYPAVSRLVGDEFFANMAVLYGRSHPPDSGDIRTHGARLPEFLEAFEPLAALPYIADVARLEWACHETLHAAQVDTGPGASKCAPIRLAPHVRMLRSPYPVAEIWDFALQTQASDSQRLNIKDSEPAFLLTLRPALDVEVVSLGPQDWHWLDGIRQDDMARQDDPVRCQSFLQRGILISC